MTATVKRKNPGALQKVLGRIQKAGTREIAVGFPAGTAQAYPDGTRVVDVAASHVFGVGVPQRDFMSLAKPDIEKKTATLLKSIAKAQVNGENKETVEALMQGAGLVAQGCIQQAIVELSDPPNSPATIERKGSDNPLIDTGHMKNAVTFVVRDKKK